MKWSWKLGAIAGIDVFVHWTFLILIGWVIAHYLGAGAGLLGALEGVVFVVAVFACIVLHELGHALTARRFGIGTQDITLLPIGGVARLERMPEDPRQELLVALGGPAVTLALAVVFLAVVLAAWGSAALLDIGLVGGNIIAKLVWVNAMLLGFNLLPAFPMDGGRVLRAALHFELDYVRATQIAASVGQGVAILFGILGLFAFNPFLILIALFVFLGAREEARSVQVRSICRDVPVHHAMVTRFRALRVDQPVDEAVDALLTGQQQDFPILEDHHVVGMLSRTDLVQAIQSGQGHQPVRDVMRRDVRPVLENDRLEDTFQRMRENGCSTIPVLRDGRLVGILTLENVGEWMMIQSALSKAKARQRVDDIYRP